MYSKAEDGIFCLPCVLFAVGSDLGQFVSKTFDNWVKKSVKFPSHNSTLYHQLSLSRVDALKSAMAKPSGSIESLLRETSRTQIERIGM